MIFQASKTYAPQPDRLKENLGGVAVELTLPDLQSIKEAASQITITGARYSEASEKMVGR